jgi:hypothetical protein
MAAGLIDHARNGDACADRLITMIAAGGALHAQRDLLTLLIGDPAYPEQRQLADRTFEEVVRAEILARFCAMRGNALDVRRLAGVLWRMAVTTDADDDRLAFASEAAALLSALADEGDGVASDHLAILGSHFPEVKAGLLIADAAILPPPIIRTDERTLGDILAAVLTDLPPPRAGVLGLLDRIRDKLVDWSWAVRLWWWGLRG